MKKITVIGPGCAKCRKLADNAKEAISKSGKDIEFEYVSDMQKIIDSGVMITPGFKTDDKLVSSGRVFSTKEILKIIEEN